MGMPDRPAPKERRTRQVREIEKRYAIPALPSRIAERLPGLLFAHIHQGYLVGGNGDRVRKTTFADGRVAYEVGSKAPAMTESFDRDIADNYEDVTTIGKDEFDKLWPGTEGFRILKTRYHIPDETGEGGPVIQLDVFGGEDEDLKGKMMAEVEFGSFAEAQTFTQPDWFGDCVTSVVSNRKLAKGRNSWFL